MANKVNYRDKALLERESFLVSQPIAVYCSLSTCTTLIMPGFPALKYDAATFTHVNCPTSPRKHIAPHKQQDTGMKIDGSH